MGKLNLKHKRITLTESVSLIKETETGKKTWVHKYLGTKRKQQIGIQQFISYPYVDFGSIEHFKRFIEDKKEKEKNKIGNL